MRTSTRRKLDLALVAGGAVTAGVLAVAGAVAGHGEEVASLWTRAVVADDGSAQVTEVIDYDFGSSFGKHGIFRIVPGLPLDAPITASSDDAPDALDVSPVPEGTYLRVGDPDRTVSGSHRYRLDYPLSGVATGTRLDWDAVGTQWEVGMRRVEIHVVAPFELLDVRCFEGFEGADAPCQVRQEEPGHLVAVVDGLEAAEGVSLEARTGSDLPAAPTPPEPPTERPDHPGSGLIPPGSLGAAGALAAGLPVLAAVRRAGRERVGAGGPADAAWAHLPAPGTDDSQTGAPSSEVRLDHQQLAEMATIEFAPPAELTPPQGGIVLTEQVQPHHKVAWLIDAAIEGSVELVTDGDGDGGAGGDGRSRGDDTRLVRRATGSAETQPVLDLAFNGRDELELGRYDRNFAAAWSQLGRRLDGWHSSSGLWDARADGRRLATRVFGALGIVVGAVAVVGGGAAANRWGPGWLPLALIGGLIAGAGVAATVAAWELHVRTPAGSATWLRVESFRRFLAESEAYHAEEAAKRGVLREYTSWAVALGEMDRWSRAVRASTAIPQDAGLHYVYAAPMLSHATMASATAPSSSSSGGGGGSVGGGAGGGGGGSW